MIHGRGVAECRKMEVHWEQKPAESGVMKKRKLKKKIFGGKESLSKLGGNLRRSTSFDADCGPSWKNKHSPYSLRANSEMDVWAPAREGGGCAGC